jgi:hypothetical protein
MVFTPYADPLESYLSWRDDCTSHVMAKAECNTCNVITRKQEDFGSEFHILSEATGLLKP